MQWTWIYKYRLAFLRFINQLCEDCNGKGFNERALKYKYRDNTIADIFDMTIQEALLFLMNLL